MDKGPITDREKLGQVLAGDLAETALRETRAKHIALEDLTAHLDRLRAAWPDLRPRLRSHLFHLHEARDLLRESARGTGGIGSVGAEKAHVTLQSRKRRKLLQAPEN